MEQDLTLSDAFAAVAATDNIDPNAVPGQAATSEAAELVTLTADAHKALLDTINNLKLQVANIQAKFNEQRDKEARLAELLIDLLSPDIKFVVEKTVEDALSGRDFESAVKDIVCDMSFSVEVSRY